MELREKLIHLRKQNGLSQLELAEKLNVSRQAISKWEVGATAPSTENLKCLGELYKVPLEDLLNDEESLKTQDLNIADKPRESKEQSSAAVAYNDAHKSKSVKLIMGIILGVLILTIVIFIFTKKDALESNNQIKNLPSEVIDIVDEDGFDIS